MSNSFTSTEFFSDGHAGVSLSASTAVQVLSLGLKGPRRPADDLIQRMHKFDGVPWFQYCMTMIFSVPTHEQLAAEAVFQAHVNPRLLQPRMVGEVEGLEVLGAHVSVVRHVVQTAAQRVTYFARRSDRKMAAGGGCFTAFGIRPFP